MRRPNPMSSEPPEDFAIPENDARAIVRRVPRLHTFPVPQLRGALALRSAEIKMLRAENDRLRQALANIREAAEMAEVQR